MNELIKIEIKKNSKIELLINNFIYCFFNKFPDHSLTILFIIWNVNGLIKIKFKNIKDILNVNYNIK